MYSKVKLSKKDKYYAAVDIVKKHFSSSNEITKNELIKVIEERLNLSHSVADEIIELLHESGDIYEVKINTFKKGLSD